jgi:hypothetical protein
VASMSSATWPPLPHPHPRQQPIHLYEWRGKLIHDDQFRHRIWASGWVQWALDKSMTTWEHHGSC